MVDWITVAQAGEIPPGKVKRVAASGLNLAVCNVAGNGDAGYYAIEDVCTHDGAELDQGELRGCEIECPRHGARFDVRSGKALCLPAVMPVPTFPLRIQGEEIQVQVAQP